MTKITVGVVQATPVFFDLPATLELVEEWLKKASQQGCQLVLFPESFIPGYPRGFTFDSSVGRRGDSGRSLYLKYWENSVEIPSQVIGQLSEWSQKYGIYLGIGITERDPQHGTLYCTLVYFSPQHGYLGKHRKIKPTGIERMIWGEGQGDSLVAINTSIGRMGGLICWENYMPLARMAMYAMGVQIYLAPTADARDNWISTLQHIALEGRCFVLSSNQFFQKHDYPEEYQTFLQTYPEDFCRGGSTIIGPDGRILAPPLYQQQGLLISEINLSDTVRQKLDFDVAGHYSRPDIFHFSVVGQPAIIQESALANIS